MTPERRIFHDHDQPCEHVAELDDWHNEVAGVFDWCPVTECPGGKEVTLRRPDPKPGGFIGKVLKEVMANVWVEVKP